MHKASLSILGLLAAASVLAYSESAHALGPVDIEIAARGGYATNPSSSDFSATPYGGGIGGRAGISVFGIYAGVSGMYYFGGSATESTPIGSVSGSLHTGMEGGELGYTLPIPFVKLRPQIGFGNSTITASAAGASESVSNLYLEPGLVVLIPLGSTFFVGGDVNALILPDATGNNGGGSKVYTSLSLHAQVGVKF